MHLRTASRKDFFKFTFLFIAVLSFACISNSAAQAQSCSGINWNQPTWPNEQNSEPNYGAYQKVKTSYNLTTNCDGEVTPGAENGYPTGANNDQFNAYVKTTPSPNGQPRNITSTSQNRMSSAGGSSSVFQRTSAGDHLNLVILQDTLWFENDSGSAVDVPFKLCYKYLDTGPAGNKYPNWADGVTDQNFAKFAYIDPISSNDITWDVSGGNKITHKQGTEYIFNKCNTGSFNIGGDGAGYYSRSSWYGNGTNRYVTSPVNQNIYAGRVETCFAITDLPDDVECWSATGVFPGCDGSLLRGLSNSMAGDVSQCESPWKVPDLTCRTMVGNPVNFAYGSKIEKQTDYAASGMLRLERTYRSNGEWLQFNMGKYWRHNYDRTLELKNGTHADTVVITTVDGTAYQFRSEPGDNDYEAMDSDVHGTFEELYDSTPTLIGYLYTTEDNNKEYYNTDFKLERIEYLGGEALDLTYDTSDRLDEVADEHGRTLEFTYDTSDRVSTVVTPDGTYTYTYDSNDNLDEVERPDTTTITYHYENTTYVNALTGITDENNVRYATWGYDSEGRVTSSEHAGSVDDYTMSYDPDNNQVTVTNALGKQTAYSYIVINGIRRITTVDGIASTHCPAAGRENTYTADGYVETSTDWEGNVTEYAYNDRGLETSRTEAVDEAEERTITTTWETNFRLPNVITEPGKTTDYDYDTYGRMTSKTVTDTNTSEARTWTYTYYANSTGAGGQTILGRLKEVNGPRTDVTDKTTYEYDTSFRLIKTTNALGQITETTAFDDADRPLTTEDANNVETDYTYDDEGRVETITVAPGTALEAVTTYTYNNVGDVMEIEQPNGVTITYSYDNARRMTGMEDDLGNTITYTLDDAGNITKEEYKNSSSTLKYEHSRAYDEMSRVIESIGAATQTTEYEYDLNSNQTKVTDAETNETEFAFDGLNRLVTQTDALSGVTETTYNDLDQITNTEDPRSNDTTYTNNAFGDVTQIVSPDTGTSSFTYDKAGNMTSKTDARSVVTNYTYDALNRLTDVEYPSDSSLDVELTYDDNPDTAGACGTSVGRLCRVVDASGTTDYKYNDLGQLIEVKETRGSLTFTTEYEYDLSGLITQITLPSGREIDYTLNANAQVSGVSADVNSTATTLASSITYLPFGPMDSMTYGNSLVLSATYDQDYYPTSRSVNTVFSHTYDTDDNGNIIQKGAWTYDYDALNRLDDQNDGSTTTAFTYDAIGNRLTENDGSTTSTYTYPSTSSKLSSVGSDSYTYDAAGNITGNDVLDFVWDAAGRLEEAKTAGTSTVVGAYVYDYANKRTSKTVSGTTTYYVYGQGGLLYGEYDNTGALIREYVYLNGEPLAQIDAGSPETLIYLHTDHLMTPRYATNTSGSTVWTWDSGAFGAETPTGTATVNLRFPGQYYDGETSLHYNWNRYYDPETGRYISSDPIGLDGGINTYLYVMANPLISLDMKGLIRWYGNLRAVSGGPAPFGAALMVMDLWSEPVSKTDECMHIRVWMSGGGASISIYPFSKTSDVVYIDDGLPYLDPYRVFNGSWEIRDGGGIRFGKHGESWGRLTINGRIIDTLELRHEFSIQLEFADFFGGISQVEFVSFKSEIPSPIR